MRLDILVPVYVDMWDDGIYREAQKTLAPDVDLHVTHLDYGTPSLESFFDVAYASPYIVDKAIELEAEGSQGLVVYCFKDPALAAVKERLDIPVVGLREAAVNMAHLIGTHIGIITSREMSVAQHKREMKGLIQRVDCLGLPVLDFLKYDKVREALERKLADAVSDGCDVIILGCGSILDLDFSDLEKKYGVTIIRPVSAAVAAIDYLARTGLTQSRLDYPKPELKDYRFKY